jgi:acetamidase/formamidase
LARIYSCEITSSTRPALGALPTTDTATDHVAHGRNADLNKAMEEAAMEMINLLVDKRKLTRLDAYALTSIAGDCRLGAASDAEKNVHCLMPKNLWQAAR